MVLACCFRKSRLYCQKVEKLLLVAQMWFSLTLDTVGTLYEKTGTALAADLRTWHKRFGQAAAEGIGQMVSRKIATKREISAKSKKVSCDSSSAKK